MLKRALGLSGGLSFAALAALLVGCPSSPPVAPDAAGTTTADTGAPPAATATALPALTPIRTCQSDKDCATGEMCDFQPGCDHPGTCGPGRMCTFDMVPYCGCDGQTFHGSGTCPAKPYAKRGPCDTPAPPAPAPPGSKKACNSSADCASGEECQGSEGCGAPWTCGPARRCTRDSVEWCACDGTTFRGSGTCPAKPVRHRGKC